MRRTSTSRIILLSLGIIAIVWLTGMNIYSLYSLHENTVNASVENQRNQVDELAAATRSRFYRSIRDLNRFDMSEMREVINRRSPMPDSYQSLLNQITEDPLLTDIYFIDARNDNCENGNVLKYNSETEQFDVYEFQNELVCDGLSLAKTRMRILIQDYKWNFRVIHDSHRSMSVALADPTERQILGYLVLPVNIDYLVDDFIKNEIVSRFGNSENSGLTVWLDDWAKREILASNNELFLERERPDFIQRFPNMLEDWHLRIRFDNLPEAVAAQASLTRNLIFLGGGVLILLGSLVFLFLTAQRERELGIRQAAFLANVTHELKTPLAVMQAAGENLADGRVTTKERLSSYGKHIYEESLRLRRMIDKLLDVAKNEAGQLSLRKELHQIDDLVEFYLQDQRNYLSSKNVDLKVNLEKPISPVMIDQNSFDTILGNLIENAVKYSPNNNFLRVSVYEKNNKVLVEVEDKGMGIPKEAQKLIFEKFYRVEDDLTANTKGHGLGLSIVKNLTEQNDGKISVSSTPGQGTVFTLEFPVSEIKEIVTSSNGTHLNKKEPAYVA